MLRLTLWLRAACEMRSDTRRRESKTLWPVLNQGKAGKGHISAEIVRQLSALRDHLNTQFGTPDVLDRAAGPNRQKARRELRCRWLGDDAIGDARRAQ